MPLTETLVADNRSYTTTRSYDAANRPVTHQYPDSKKLHWIYNNRNLVTGIEYGNGTDPVGATGNKAILTQIYDNGYRLTNQVYGNDLTRTINYNRQDNLRTSDSVFDGTQAIKQLSFDYTYAADKQITAETILAAGNDPLSSTGFTAQYDPGNRLTAWTRDGSVGNQNGGPASAKNQQWNYDAAGNWTSTTKTIGNNTTTENRQHSVSDQVTSIGNNAATHDAKGNLTAYEINGKEYEVDYDLDNRIIKADIDGDDVEYRYDAFGRRVIRKEGSTKTALIWWVNSECAEYKHSSGQASIQNDLFAHPTRLNAVIARAVDGSKSKLQWYHKNYLDHVYAVSDDDGDLLEHYRYTAFGEVTIYNATGIQQSTTQINNQILWNTRRRDTVSGYYMYKFRHYSAELGRWLARDPIEEKGGVNLYGFVGNDPVSNWDYLGQEYKLYDEGGGNYSYQITPHSFPNNHKLYLKLLMTYGGKHAHLFVGTPFMDGRDILKDIAHADALGAMAEFNFLIEYYKNNGGISGRGHHGFYKDYCCKDGKEVPPEFYHVREGMSGSECIRKNLENPLAKSLHDSLGADGVNLFLQISGVAIGSAYRNAKWVKKATKIKKFLSLSGPAIFINTAMYGLGLIVKDDLDRATQKCESLVCPKGAVIKNKYIKPTYYSYADAWKNRMNK